MPWWRRDHLAENARCAFRRRVSPPSFLAIAACALAFLCACERAPTQPQATPAPAPTGDKVTVAQAQLDAVAARLDLLVRRAEAAGADPAALIAVADAFETELVQARAALATVARSLSEADQRALQAHYGLRVGPALSRLQVLLFPVHLARLPQGATPAAAATPAQTP